jgi:hypothetical protein
MDTFLKEHAKALLVTLSVIFSVIIIGSFVWGVIFLVGQWDQASASGNDSALPQGFNLAGAAKLDYKNTAKPVMTVATTTSTTTAGTSQ